MKKYEYRVVICNKIAGARNIADTHDKLNKHGECGYRVVSMSTLSSDNLLVIMEREKKTPYED